MDPLKSTSYIGQSAFHFDGHQMTSLKDWKRGLCCCDIIITDVTTFDLVTDHVIGWLHKTGGVLLLRSKYECVFLNDCGSEHMYSVSDVCVCYWQMKHIPCTGTRCNIAFLCASLLHSYANVCKAVYSAFIIFKRMDWWMNGWTDMFVYRQDGRWWLAHLWKEDRKCLTEEKTGAYRYLTSTEGSNSTKTKAETNTMWTNYT